jgi:hypothetical protein
VEDLVELSLQEISQPLNPIPPTPNPTTSPISTEFFESHFELKSKSESLDTSFVFLDVGKNRNQNQPWLARDALAFPG